MHMQEAGQGKADGAEAAWVEREAEMAEAKAKIAELTETLEMSMGPLTHNLPEAEEDRRRRHVEKQYARHLKNFQEENLRRSGE